MEHALSRMSNLQQLTARSIQLATDGVWNGRREEHIGIAITKIDLFDGPFLVLANSSASPLENVGMCEPAVTYVRETK